MFPRLSTAAGDPAEFKRAFDISLRPLLLLAVLGAVGTYLFADVAVGLIYTREKFGPAADTLRAFVPVLLLMYIDVFLANAVVAAGRVGRLAGAKVAAVVLVTGLAFVLVPYCQQHFGNGGPGVMYAIAIGELVMLVTSGFILRDAIDSHTLGDVLRCLIAGAATVWLMSLVAGLTPFVTIPSSIVVFGIVSLLVGAAKRSDLQMLLAHFRKPSTAAAGS
jgi:O-antigen/teichoic acid export membrane protein